MDSNYFGVTDTGKLRSNNEDTFIAEKIAGTDFVIACVIDGVGGYTGGEVAAAIARQTVLNLLSDPDGDLSLLMQATIAEANDQIIAAKIQRKEHEDMACVLTLSLVDLNKNQFYYAHVGDTRLYLLRDGSLIKISRDQSFVGFMEDSGRLTEEQAMSHPKRNEINKALGFTGNISAQEDYIETGNSPFLPGDLILLCSDGLSDMVNKQDITAILLAQTSLEQKGMTLVDTANRNGGRDNITVVLVKNDKTSLRHEVTKPVSRAKQNKIVQKPVSTSTVQPDHESLPLDPEPEKQRKAKGTKLAFIVAGLIVLAAMIYFLWWQNAADPADEKDIPPTRIAAEDSQAIKLQDTLNKLRGNILILDDSVFKSPILISKPISITRDSLYLKAEGHIVIKSDTGYSGQPFFIAPANKSTLLENFTFENFKEVSTLQKKGVLLKDVKFTRTDSLINQPNR
ncbi:PP2C family protein-serine/threonine phosphatase [Pedobacter heparinus]|uniref:PP2C family protein-serine/threonine phosphatase n=1 Tax=Pedobacter heparinus TaxID=984 RepID=UPI0029311874|nr:protein phosphatase 2C domain-containing protein [Pedobacter heparinus]